MREQTLCAVRPRHDRHRRPQPARAVLGRNRCAQTLADVDAVAVVAVIAHGIFRNGLRHEGRAELFVMCVTAGRKHDAFAGLDRNFFAADVQRAHL